MRCWFLNRNYPKKLIDDQLNRVKNLPESQLFERKTRQNDPGVPLVVTFHPLLSGLGSILYKHLAILYVDESVKNVFTPAHFVSFRSGFNLSNHLVRSKVYPLERKRGSFKCGKKRCKTCKNVNETTTFKSYLDNKKYVINHSPNCDDNCIIYLLTCKVCGIQYVGQTTNRFRYRWNNYRSSNKRVLEAGEPPQKELHLHFEGEDHTDFFK